MGIMTNDRPDPEPLIDDSELDDFWERWSYTNQLYYVMAKDEDYELIVRAVDANEAAVLYVQHMERQYRWSRSKAIRALVSIFKIPSQAGLSCAFRWHDDVVKENFTFPANFTSGGNK